MQLLMRQRQRCAQSETYDAVLCYCAIERDFILGEADIVHSISIEGGSSAFISNSYHFLLTFQSRRLTNTSFI